MLEYDRIDAWGGTDVNKTNGLLESIIYNYWYFLDINFRFQMEVCNGCRHLIKKIMSFNNVVIVTVKGNYCRIHFLYMSKNEAINLLRNADLTGKSRTL